MDMTEKKCAICSHVFSGDLLQCPKCGSGVFESEKTRSQLFAQESDSLSNEVINANPLLSSGPKKKCNWLKRLLNTLASKKRLYSKLMDAIESNDIDSLRRIIKKGVDVNYSKTPGRTWTPLMFASYNGNLEAVKYLIAAGANINAQADNTYDMISGEPNEIIEGRGRTALMEAVHQGNTETVDFLLENNADPNPKDRFGNTALYIAADFSFKRDKNTSGLIAQMLIDHGAHFDSCNDFRETALKRAAWSENSDVVNVLLRAGADPNLQDDKGGTAIMGAAYHCDELMVDMLLTYGAEPNIKRNDGRTALSFAEEKNCEVVALRLRKEIYGDSRVLENGKETPIFNEVIKLIGLKDIDSLKKLGKSVVPELIKGLDDSEHSNRRFIRDALRIIDVNAFLHVSQENCLILDMKLYVGMSKPIDLHIILTKERDEIIWAILANIAVLQDFNFFVIEMAGEIGANKKDIQALFGDGVVHVLEGVEGRELIHERLINIASNYSYEKRCRYLLIGPLSSDVFTLTDIRSVCASIYYVGLNNCETIIETFSGYDSCKQYQIVSVVATDDQLMDNHDAMNLRRHIDERAVNLAEPILRNYYNSL